MYRLTKEELEDFSLASRTEVYMPNGVGGFLGLSASNCLIKKQNAYLIHSSKEGRVVLLSKIIEAVEIDGEIFSLDSQEFLNKRIEGNKYLTDFSYYFVPTLTYDIKGVRIIKSLAPDYNSSAIGVTYMVMNSTNERVRLILTPLFDEKKLGECNINKAFEIIESRGQITVCHKNLNCYFKFSDGIKVKRSNTQYENIKYQFDFDNGDRRVDTSFTPYDIYIDIANNTNKLVELTCATYPNRLHAKNIILAYNKRLKRIKRETALNDQFAERLALSCDTFIYKEGDEVRALKALPNAKMDNREALIGFTGAFLATKRFLEAKSFLLAFKNKIDNGLIAVADGNDNYIIDTSLWYFICVYNYYKYTNDLSFIMDNLFSSLEEIYLSFKTGTAFNVSVDTDGLVSLAKNDNILTWMNINIPGKPLTPRYGKPVEVNALWYNALMILAYFSKLNNSSDLKYQEEAKLAYQSFNNKFWNNDGYLFDVIEENDKRIRPNMLYSLALPFKLIDKNKGKLLVNCCKNELYTKYGLRGLSINDPEFKPKYEGSLWNRNMAYHMGSVFPYLMGIYIDSYLYVNDNSKDSISECKKLLINFNSHMHEYSLNGICEILDGENPRESRGSSSYFLGSAEILRAYYENLLKYNIRLRIDKK